MGAPRKRRRGRGEAEVPRTGLAADVRPTDATRETSPAPHAAAGEVASAPPDPAPHTTADAPPDPAPQDVADAPPRARRPDVADRHGPDAARGAGTRSEARNAAIREQLEPLAPGERPLPLTIAVVVAVAVALLNLGLLAAGYTVSGEDGAGTTYTAIGVAGILLVAAGGMWARRYWAVLLFEVVLGITCVYAGLSLLVASNAVAALLSVVIAGLTGVLFYKLVRVMARIQVPES